MKFTNEKITNFSALTDEERTTAFAALDNDALTASIEAHKTEIKTLFALTEPTIAQVDEAEALVASLGKAEAEAASREAAVKDAAARFAKARETFTVNDGVETGNGEDADGDGEADDAEYGDEDGEDADAEDGEDADGDADGEGDGEGEGDATVTASGVDHTKSQIVKTSAARKVGRRTKRPDVAKASPVTITAAADVPKFYAGQVLDGMEQVTQGLLNRAKGFPKFNLSAAEAALSASGGVEVLNKFAVASFAPNFDTTMVADKASNDYSAYQTAIKDQKASLEKQIQAALSGDLLAMTAAGWCAPSENVYSWIADFVVDGLVKNPEVKAPRGGLNITTGPAHVTQGSALDDFGFVQTEAQAEAGTVKTCETIECPTFEDHRLDAIGYCYKIPILTQKAYPELITDALRLADVLYAHKVNRRTISDMVALSDDVDFSGYGASFTDSLEALSILATRERRKWNLGENAIMLVKAPLLAREVYRADMSRRTGLALTDVATDQKIAAEFAARRLVVEYVADWQELPSSGPLTLPGEFKVMVYPAGTFVTAIEDVINLSAVHDAASLSVNEYTGVFFEQGYMTVQVGYGSSLLTIPINTAGETGAAIMQGIGDARAHGSF